MKINKVLSTFIIMGSLTFSTPASAFTDAAIEFAQQYIIDNAEEIARSVFRFAVGKVASNNTEDKKFVDGVVVLEGVEGQNEKIDSFCAKGSAGLEGCKDLITGGASVRSCAGKFCGADPKVALLIEAKCGLLSSRNLMKKAEFETSACAANAWGTLRANQDVLATAIGGTANGSVDNVFQFKKGILLGLMETFDPQIAGAAEGYSEDEVNKKLKEYLENDTKGIIEQSVKQMASMASDRAAYKAALSNPEAFAKRVAASLGPSATAKKAVGALPQKAGSRQSVAPTKSAPVLKMGSKTKSQ